MSRRHNAMFALWQINVIDVTVHSTYPGYLNILLYHAPFTCLPRSKTQGNNVPEGGKAESEMAPLFSRLYVVASA